MPPSVDEPIQYTIQPEDTLWDLAAEYLGSPLLWRVIKDASQIKNHRLIRPAQVLVIPGTSARLNCLFQKARLERKSYLVFSARTCSSDFEPPYLRPPSLEGLQITLENLLPSLKGISLQDYTLENDDFSLSWEEVTEKTPADDAALSITMRNNNVWSADTTVLQEVRENFIALCITIESDLAPILHPVATELIRQRIAESLPSTIRDSLFYRCRFNYGYGNNNSPYVDLLPGMRLKLEFNTYQNYMGNGDLSGYSNAGHVYYTLNRHSVRSTTFDIGNDYQNQQQLSFDPFLSTLSSPQISTTSKLASGLPDLEAASASRRHFRLLYPTNVNNAEAEGEVHHLQNVTLIGADSLEALEKATEYYQKGQTYTKDNVATTVFRGRVTAIPEIPVTVNGIPRYISLGTTVRHVIDGLLPAWNPITLHRKNLLNMERLYLRSDGMPRYHDVIFAPGDYENFDPAVYDLPLVHGDKLSLNELD